jgi:S1-C subfamily serine protease
MNASIRLIELVVPATVAIEAEVPSEHPSASVLGTARRGSGIVVDSGLILTVNYVVLGAHRLVVTFLDDRRASGTVVAKDFASGIAVIEADGAARPGLRTRSAPLQVGDEIFIVAAAAENARRANNGAVTSVDRFDASWEYSLDRAIMTTAMNPGLGGAPLLDLYGSVAGVVSLELNEVGRFTLAIPIAHYADHREELLRHGRRVSRPARAWVGFYCYTLRDLVIIAGVLPGGPGEQAGLRAGDVVIAVDGQAVAGRHELYRRLWSRQPGEIVNFHVHRDKDVKHVPVATGDAEQFFA